MTTNLFWHRSSGNTGNIVSRKKYDGILNKTGNEEAGCHCNGCDDNNDNNNNGINNDSNNNNDNNNSEAAAKNSLQLDEVQAEEKTRD